MPLISANHNFQRVVGLHCRTSAKVPCMLAWGGNASSSAKPPSMEGCSGGAGGGRASASGTCHRSWVVSWHHWSIKATLSGQEFAETPSVQERPPEPPCWWRPSAPAGATQRQGTAAAPLLGTPAAAATCPLQQGAQERILAEATPGCQGDGREVHRLTSCSAASPWLKYRGPAHWDICDKAWLKG